ncbi:MAG: hypothetical protein NT080_05755 [Spirochaetes bacterium]|nr:hypothetical protein [Spirochaetota bacterium]
MSCLRAFALLGTAFFAVVFAAAQPTQSPAAGSSLASRRGDSDFPAILEKAFQDAPTIEAAASVLSENLPFVKDQAKHRSLALALATLYELLGRFAAAADRYEEAAYSLPSARDTPSLLAACAARIASGDAEKAEGILKALALTADDPATAIRARILSGWAALVSGRRAEAETVAETALVQAEKAAALRLDALVLAWAAAEGKERESYAAAIQSEYGSSPQAAVAGGAAPPPMAHWLLSGLFDADRQYGQAASPSAQAGPDGQVPVSTPMAGKTETGDKAPPAAKAADGKGEGPSGFQIGAFTEEKNAIWLKDGLVKAGFRASIVRKADVSAWVVVVEPGADPQATLMKLKDAGFEAFPVY